MIRWGELLLVGGLEQAQVVDAVWGLLFGVIGAAVGNGGTLRARG